MTDNTVRPAPPETDSEGDITRKATASLILSIAGLLTFPSLVLGIAGVVVGKRALAEIEQSRGELGGEARARYGIALGWTSIGLGVVVLAAYGIMQLIWG